MTISYDLLVVGAGTGNYALTPEIAAGASGSWSPPASVVRA
jgi:pyruvate/2-oxoglutarate dehydrogenase complex dihydrolipoamide dehydrogenase (E3) component